MDAIVMLFKRCWLNRELPEQWHVSRVFTLFKKGDTALCVNYRPISLVCSGYKLFAYILLHRFVDGHVDSRLGDTQYGFRPNRGTMEAMFIARRIIDVARAVKGGRVTLLALDWSKAFDSISPDGLVRALTRFGIPREMVDMVCHMYRGRSFYVRDCGASSEERAQAFGISQGCPLAPKLFVIIMAVLMHDAKELLATRGITLCSDFPANELLFADDTLLIDRDAEVLQTYMQCVSEVGKEYGLVFNLDKLELLSVGQAVCVFVAAVRVRRCVFCVQSKSGVGLACARQLEVVQ